MNKLHIYTIMLLVAFTSQVAIAQSLKPDVVVCAGSTGSDATFTTSWTIGETVTETCASAGNCLTQGFQQPELPVVTSMNAPMPIQAQFVLDQNYPNPFSGSTGSSSTTITFSTPRESSLVIRVYDIHGTFVQTIVDGRYTRGRYEVEFDAGKLPSGSYYYTLECEKHILKRRMTLLK